MSKKVHPYAHRLVILRDWKSRWFAKKDKFREYLHADVAIRNWIKKNFRTGYISSVEIERSPKFTRIIVRTSRPGLIIGRQGEGARRLKAGVSKLLKKKGYKVPEDLKIDIQETKNPDANAAIIAYSVAEGLEKRVPFRRVIKMALEKVMAVRGVQGARIVVAGRLNGAEMARRESVKKGSIPLQTFRADVDFSRERAKLPYGTIGIKVWIYKGEVFEKDKK